MKLGKNIKLVTEFDHGYILRSHLGYFWFKPKEKAWSGKHFDTEYDAMLHLFAN